MTTIQLQVRIPKDMIKEIDKWIKEGKFVSRSEAVKTIVALYRERERTKMFYQLLLRRSSEAKEKPNSLLPLDEIR